MWNFFASNIGGLLRLQFILSVVLLCSFSGSDVRAKDWDFSANLLTGPDDLKMSEEDYWNLSCAERMNALYRQYAIKHSEFSPLKHQPGMRRKWRRAMIDMYRAQNLDSPNFCFYQILGDAIWNIDLNYHLGGVVFCGVEANNISRQAAELATRAEELLEYALEGSQMASFMILSAHQKLDAVNINPDIRFYIHALLEKHEPLAIKQSREQGYDYFPNDAEYGLSPDRLAKIREAAKRRDSSIVLNEFTTCSTEDL